MGYIENALVSIAQAGIVVKSGLTDSTGKYSTVLGAGTYTITISKTGYETIVKTETLAQATELMVNLADTTELIGRSGIILQYLTRAVDNPTLTSIPTEAVSSNRGTSSIQTSNLLDAAPSTKTGNITTVNSLSVA